MRNGIFISPNREAGPARQWQERIGIRTPDIRNNILSLSGGNQQRIVLAKWMATNPRVLILDSPTVGVDIRAKDGIYEIIRRLAREGVRILEMTEQDYSLEDVFLIIAERGARAAA